MPFSADATVCAALLRTGDKLVEPKAALKWAKAICKALKPKVTGQFLKPKLQSLQLAQK